MAIDQLDLASAEASWDREWTRDDVLLYAVGVGAGLDDPTVDLQFTTENSVDTQLLVLPTFAALITQPADHRYLGDIDPTTLVHATQSITLHRKIPLEGRCRVVATTERVEDKGSGMLVVSRVLATDRESGDLLVTAERAVFIKDAGGFGGPHRTTAPWVRPDREPDMRITYATREDQALIYRLCGDRNPLHSDPSVAARAGFRRPILQGLCTFGFTGRALLREIAGNDPSRFGGMSGRFSAPVTPGESLVVSMWRTATGASYQTSRPDGTVVVDHGSMRLAEPSLT